MQLVLTDDETRMLRDILSDTLTNLRREVARTDAKPFRHQLVLRLDFVERLLTRLADEVKV